MAKKQNVSTHLSKLCRELLKDAVKNDFRARSRSQLVEDMLLSILLKDYKTHLPEPKEFNEVK
jgi:hypothetical protein